VGRSRSRFHVVSFGCRASQSEGASIEAELGEAGRSLSDSPFDADVVVINSCTVTAEADRDVDRLIRRLNRRNPSARIIVTGCYAQRSPETLAARPQVRYVVGNSHKSQVGRLAEACLEDPAGPGRSEVFCSDAFGLEPLRHQGSAGRTRATVKVQDGCNANCAFCVIPAVRGRSRSLDPSEVVAQVRDLVSRGYREVVFSGIHLGSWGRDLGGSGRLVDLVAKTLTEVPELERLRLSSIEPLEVTGELIGLAASEPRIARHLHVPMQSGSDRVLRAMRRPCSATEYGARVRRIGEAVPDAAIGADVMVGFPGETDRDFLGTFRLIEALPLTYLHVFPYSSRPGTAAADLGDPVPAHVVRHRADTLRRLGSEKNARFRGRFPGRRLEVLALGEDGSGGRRGLSDNFVEVSLGRDLEINRWHEVQILAVTGSGLDARGEADSLQASRMTTAAETV
jgi:threonylcarbamoyladenosine tRNA methylthiotransferase MtaB